MESGKRNAAGAVAACTATVDGDNSVFTDSAVSVLKTAHSLQHLYLLNSASLTAFPAALCLSVSVLEPLATLGNGSVRDERSALIARIRFKVTKAESVVELPEACQGGALSGAASAAERLICISLISL